MDGEQAVRQTLQESEEEEWSDRDLDDKLVDVHEGYTEIKAIDQTRGALAYGLVVGENPKLAEKWSGFPEFGDVVIFNANSGMDCSSFGRMPGVTGSISEYKIANADGTRYVSARRAEKLVMIEAGRGGDVYCTHMKFNEFQNQLQEGLT